jgi:GNAT superfamily N-acetyltransferase
MWRWRGGSKDEPGDEPIALPRARAQATATVDDPERGAVAQMMRRLWQTLRSVRDAGWSQGAPFVYRTWFVFRRSLTSLKEVETPSGISFRLATMQDLEGLSVFETYRTRQDLRRWLGAPDTFWVTVALDDERIIGFNCASSTAPEDRLFSGIPLAPHQAWVRELYVLPEYRRHHVASQLRTARNRLLRKVGFSETVSTVRADNYPSLRHTYVGDLREIHRLHYLGLLGFRWTCLEYDTRRALEAHLGRFRRRRPPCQGE